VIAALTHIDVALILIATAVLFNHVWRIRELRRELEQLRERLAQQKLELVALETDLQWRRVTGCATNPTPAPAPAPPSRSS
jgi:hypothetical protein